jgi:chemotaxis protein methyltransferase CheR
MNPPWATGEPTLLKAQEPVSKLLRDLVHERTGIYFDSDRLDTMIEKLEPRATAHACQTYLDYYYILKYDSTGTQEWRRVMDAFSVQETYFWREPDQIRALVDHVVPAWFKQSSLPLRIWSAACATGEEPYTLVMALREAGWEHHPIEIFASDASETALAKAREAVYGARSFRSFPLAMREKYFDPAGDRFALHTDVASRVKFQWANLVALDTATEIPPVNVIFCRNVFIYFSTGTIRRVLDSFAQRLPAEGTLFVGASESLLKLTPHFELQEIGGAFAYVRNRS